jgi:hypothetical protein
MHDSIADDEARNRTQMPTFNLPQYRLSSATAFVPLPVSRILIVFTVIS